MTDQTIQLTPLCDECNKHEQEIKYLKFLLNEYKREKKPLEPHTVKTYITSQVVNGKRYKTTKRTTTLASTVHDKRKLRKKIIDLLDQYDDNDIMQVVCDVLTDNIKNTLQVSVNEAYFQGSSQVQCPHVSTIVQPVSLPQAS